jgi:hypothetical protein
MSDTNDETLPHDDTTSDELTDLTDSHAAAAELTGNTEKGVDPRIYQYL